MAHEREHVVNEQAKAERDDRRVINQTVSLTMSTCSECGRMYVSGGTTRTTTASKNENDSADTAAAENTENKAV
jgi:ribosomal protein L32